MFGGDGSCPWVEVDAPEGRRLIVEHAWGDELPGDSRGGSGTPTDKNNRGEGYARAATRGCFCESCGAWLGQLGREPTPQLYVEHLVTIFREVRRVLRKDGVLWLVLGDSYASNWPCSRRSVIGQGALEDGTREARPPRMGGGLKDKDLIGIPWRVAFALQDDGWWLRQDVIWSKPNPMPESVEDRCTRSHEHVFMLTKSARYYYDAAAVAEPWASGTAARLSQPDLDSQQGGYKVEQYQADFPGRKQRDRRPADILRAMRDGRCGSRNLHSVWTIPTESYDGAHYATFPRELARRCIRAGSREGDIVLDPFCGSGTTVEAANAERRVGIGLDLVHTYCRDHAVKRARKGIAEGRQLAMRM